VSRPDPASALAGDPLRRLLPLIRTVSGDRTVQVRPGPQTAYVPALHVVEFSEEILGWTEPEWLAVAGHEGGHVRISGRLEDLPLEVRTQADEMAVLNCLEDARVNAWVAHQFPGLRTGLCRATDRTWREVLKGDPENLVPPFADMPEAWQYVWALRAAIDAWPHDVELSPAVVQALDDTRELAASAIDAYPRVRATDEEAAAIRQDAEWFAAVMVEVVLPHFRALRPRGEGKGEAGPKGRAKALLQKRRAQAVDDQLRRQAERSTPSAWREWAAARERARTPRGKRPAGVPRSYAEAANGLATEIDIFQRLLAPALLKNEALQLASGFDSGGLPDIREAFLAERDPDARLRMWQRPVVPSLAAYRIALVIDISESMEGAPMAAAIRCLIICLEAAERLGFPTAAVVFGQRAEPPGNVRVVKEMEEPLREARATISQLIERTNHGYETPLAEALDRCRTALYPRPPGRDLVLVVTDGNPSATVRCYFDRPTPLNTVNDAGEKVGSVKAQGWVEVFRPEPEVDHEVKLAVARLEAIPDVCLIGIGAGAAARVEKYFRRRFLYEDFRSFAEGFPAFVRRTLHGLLEGAG